MRHKKLCLGMKFLGPRVMLALQVWLWLLLFIFQNEFRISFAAEPGYLDFDNLPETNFSCTGKVIGGYYADLETDCQMFHVCTIGQLEEPMDIKFLCLNGTVFDQETRVCERVDEVDCSKSEHFYSLNLELYGNTAPPIIKAEPMKHPEDDIDEDEYDDLEDVYDSTTTTTRKPTTTTTTMATTTTTTTPKPVQSSTSRPYHTTPKITYYQTTVQSFKPLHHPSSAIGQEHDEEEDEVDYDLPGGSNKTSPQVPKPIPNLIQKNNLNNEQQDSIKPTEISDNSQIFSPQQFIYHHHHHNHNGDYEMDPRGKSPAISFQQHSYSSNGQNGHVTVTTHTGRVNFNGEGENVETSTPNNFQKRIPLVPPSSQIQPPTGHPGLPSAPPKHQKETIYYNYNKPQGFKPSPASQNYNNNNNNNKQSVTTPRIVQNYQPSERHEVALDSDYEFEKLSPDFPYIHQDFSSHYHFDKRSQGANKYDIATEQSTDSKTTSTTPYYNSWATRNNNYTKSLPRVIVTASASVSDSNGKKLNYTVGNLVHAVKPLVPSNYDDYKESDVLLDPFFLDVPKLKNRRTKRQIVIKAFKDDTETKKEKIDPDEKDSVESGPWVPPDYVDDNYEPVVYKSPTEVKFDDASANKYAKLKPSPTTESSVAKTTLDVAKIEDTTPAFKKKESSSKNYKLLSVTSVILNNSSDKVVTKSVCTDKKYYKFYPDKTNCRTFHVCVPGHRHHRSDQILDMLFICDLGMFFDRETMSCVRRKPNDGDCES